MTGRILALSLATLVLAATPASGQMAALSGDGGDSSIEVQAENGIEWQQDRQVFVARGNARAVRGDVTVNADELRAYYREKQGGGTDITRLDAVGHVKIVSTRGSTATGDSGVYDVDTSTLVLSGKNVRFVSGEDVITADQQIEYYDKKNLAVARGNAVAKRGDKVLRSNVLVGYMREANGKTDLQRVEAFDNVQIVTQKDKVWAERGVYSVDTGMAVLTGSVRLVRDGNTLTGCRAEVDLNSGLSKLKSCAQDGRVQGILRPGQGARLPSGQGTR